MDTHSDCFLLQGFSALQNRRVQLNEKERFHIFYLFDLLYVKAAGQYTLFYVMETPRSGRFNIIKMSYNLSKYDWLLRFEFVQADRGTYFNLNYLTTFSNAYEVKLSHRHEHAILVTPDCRPDLKIALNALKGSNSNPQLTLFA